MSEHKNEGEQTLSISIRHDDPILDLTSKAIDINELKLTYNDPTPQGRRVAPRYPVELEVIILTQTRSFRTRSINVSSTGALLKEPLPEEFMKSPLDIIFIRTTPKTKKRLLFRGKAVGGPLRSPRITFQSSTQDSALELKEEFKDREPLPYIA